MNDKVKQKQQELIGKYEREIEDFRIGKKKVSLLMSLWLIPNIIYLLIANFSYSAGDFWIEIISFSIIAFHIGMMSLWAYLIYYCGQKMVVYLMLLESVFTLVSSSYLDISVLIIALQLGIECVLVFNEACTTYLEKMSGIRAEAIRAVKRERQERRI